MFLISNTCKKHESVRLFQRFVAKIKQSEVTSELRLIRSSTITENLDDDDAKKPKLTDLCQLDGVNQFVFAACVHHLLLRPAACKETPMLTTDTRHTCKNWQDACSYPLDWRR